MDGTPGFHKTLRATLVRTPPGRFHGEELSRFLQGRLEGQEPKAVVRKIGRIRRSLDREQGMEKKEGWKDREDLYEDALTLPPPSVPVWTYGFYDASALQQKVLRTLCSGQETPSRVSGQAMENAGSSPYEEDHPAFEYAKPFVEWAESFGTVKKLEKFKSEKATALGRLQNNLFKTEIAPPSSQLRRIDRPPSPDALAKGDNDSNLSFEDFGCEDTPLPWRTPGNKGSDAGHSRKKPRDARPIFPNAGSSSANLRPTAA